MSEHSRGKKLVHSKTRRLNKKKPQKKNKVQPPEYPWRRLDLRKPEDELK